MRTNLSVAQPFQKCRQRQILSTQPSTPAPTLAILLSTTQLASPYCERQHKCTLVLSVAADMAHREKTFLRVTKQWFPDMIWEEHAQKGTGSGRNGLQLYRTL